MREVVRLSEGLISWEALSAAVALCACLYSRWQIEQKVELLWAGPAPAGGMPARRIDQVLYDLIATAQKDILPVTFAAHKIHRLAEILASASRRGARVRMVLEFGVQSHFPLLMTAKNQSATVTSVTLHVELANQIFEHELWFKARGKSRIRTGDSGVSG